jgi:hypothetical protein
VSGDRLTLQTILQVGYAAYERSHAGPEHVRRAVWALLACRTALLGGHVQACPEGHIERVWYHACRHRMWPPCAWLQVERWLARQKACLLACEPYHVIVTMPHELNTLWLANVDVSGMCTSGSAIRTGKGCWSTWPAPCGEARSPIGGCSRVRVSRSSSGMKRGPKAPGARRNRGR